MFAVTCLVSSSLAPRDDIVVDEEMLVVFWVAGSASIEGYPKVLNILRHYAKQALAPLSLNVKFGSRRKNHNGWVVWFA